MRVHSLGRGFGHLVAVAALGLGGTVGIAAADAVDEVSSSGGGVTVASSDEAPDEDASTDSYEWN